MTATFADTLTVETAAFDVQPQEPTTGPCVADCSRPPVGWTWTGVSWAAACPSHKRPTTIFNTEFLEDW